MPTEIFDIKEFIRLSEKADHCRVKRSKDVVKLKLRTKRMLYTIKLPPGEAEGVLRSLKCPVKEIKEKGKG
ncbi:50S ribosomal protein L38e [Candidatus Bathyarchaeota archaeon]|nr:50S ribosomal protein L38e [Candidatus Bathyarchaeota archaeon]